MHDIKHSWTCFWMESGYSVSCRTPYLNVTRWALIHSQVILMSKKMGQRCEHRQRLERVWLWHR